jgi:cyclic-di-GMP-binding protein
VPTFDVVSEVDLQEVRNAVDQAQREVTTRFDFKDTGSTVELGDGEIRLHSSTPDRLKALVQVLEEKLVRRDVPLKAMAYGEVEDAAKGTVRQTVKLSVGISDVKARELNKFIKDRKVKGVSSQAQGDQVRVQSKKRDDLQGVIAALKGEDFGIPLQFKNFRD